MRLKNKIITQLKKDDIPDLRNKILKIQKGKCPLCNKLITDPCLDHDHKKKIKGTGLIRGVLCRNCNSFIAKLENNCMRCGLKQKELPRILKRMAIYLKKEQYPFLHPTEKEKEPKLQRSSYNKLKRIYSGKRKFPEYPKSGKITVSLKKLYNEYKLRPKFYAK